MPDSPPTNRLEVFIDEPLTSETKCKMRAELMKHYHAFRRYIYGQETKIHWTSDYNETTGMFTLSSSITPLNDPLRKFCNKPTAMYWTQSAQTNDRCPLVTFASFYKKWFRCHNNDPNLEFGHFFANPIRVTSTGPSTTVGIFEAHKLLCNNAVSLLDLVE